MFKRTLKLAAFILGLTTLVYGGATFSRVKTWISGETLTASDLNAEFDNVLNNMTLGGVDDYSASVAQMRTTAAPYPSGVESQATSAQGEIERLRFQLHKLLQVVDPNASYWYSTAPASGLLSLNSPSNQVSVGTTSFPAGAGLVYMGGTTTIRGPMPWIDVKAYGAMGDGTTDDTTAIQAAINAVPLSGGVVWIPAGLYVITSSITILTDDLIIRGAGEVTTKLIMSSGTSGGIVYGNHSAISPRRGRIESLGITGPGSVGNGITIRGNDLALDHVRAVNWQYGVDIDDSVLTIVNTKLEHCRIESNLVGGIRDRGVGSQAVTSTNLVQSRFTSNGSTTNHYQIDLTGAQIGIDKCVIEPNSAAHGIKIGASSSGVEITNCYHENSDVFLGNVALDDVRGIFYSGNYMAGLPTGSTIQVNLNSVRGGVFQGNYHIAASSYAYHAQNVSSSHIGPNHMISGTMFTPNSAFVLGVTVSSDTQFRLYGQDFYIAKNNGAIILKGGGNCFSYVVSSTGAFPVNGSSVTCP